MRQTVKILHLKKQDGGGRHLKKHKNRDITTKK